MYSAFCSKYRYINKDLKSWQRIKGPILSKQFSCRIKTSRDSPPIHNGMPATVVFVQLTFRQPCWWDLTVLEDTISTANSLINGSYHLSGPCSARSLVLQCRRHVMVVHLEFGSTTMPFVTKINEEEAMNLKECKKGILTTFDEEKRLRKWSNYIII